MKKYTKQEMQHKHEMYQDKRLRVVQTAVGMLVELIRITPTSVFVGAVCVCKSNLVSCVCDYYA